MAIIVTRWADINLGSVYRVAWRREPVTIGDEALRRIAECRAAFLNLIDEEPANGHLRRDDGHGGTGEPATGNRRARPSRATQSPSQPPLRLGDPCRIAWCGALFSLDSPTFWRGMRRPVRGSPGRRRHARRGSDAGGPGAGQGGAGEILALYPLFADLSARFVLEVKERGSLINGSPCAAAFLADAALAARRRLRLAEQTFSLSIEAFRAPLEHYDPALDALWGDEDEAAALRGLRHFLAGADL